MDRCEHKLAQHFNMHPQCKFNRILSVSELKHVGGRTGSFKKIRLILKIVESLTIPDTYRNLYFENKKRPN